LYLPQSHNRGMSEKALAVLFFCQGEFNRFRKNPLSVSVPQFLIRIFIIYKKSLPFWQGLLFIMRSL